MDKKGFMLSTIRGPIYLLLVICTAFIAMYVWIEFSDTFSPIVSDSVSQGIITAGQNATIQSAMTSIRSSISYLDFMMPLLVAGLMLLSLISAFRSGKSLIFAFASVVIWIFSLMLCAIYTNVFEVFSANFAAVGSYYVIMSYIMTNIKWIVLVWLFVLSVVMFTRNKSNDGGINSMTAPQGMSVDSAFT